MNLHGIVRGSIGAINPDIDATLSHSTGFTTDDAGYRTPSYVDYAVKIQVQGVKEGALIRSNALNMQSVLRNVYVSGNWGGIIRTHETGGDLLKFPMAKGGIDETWKILQVNEAWPDWTSVTVCLQVSA